MYISSIPKKAASHCHHDRRFSTPRRADGWPLFALEDATIETLLWAIPADSGCLKSRSYVLMSRRPPDVRPTAPPTRSLVRGIRRSRWPKRVTTLELKRELECSAPFCRPHRANRSPDPATLTPSTSRCFLNYPKDIGYSRARNALARILTPTSAATAPVSVHRVPQIY